FPFEHYLRPAAIGSAKRFAQSLQDRDQPLAIADLGNALRHPLELVNGAIDRYAFKRSALQPIQRLDIGCCAEQVPDPESRVTLSDRRDALGQPLARLDWRIADLEFLTYQKAAQLFLQECRRLRLETPTMSPWLDTQDGSWRAALHDMAHPMCTTRMAHDERHGVVDRNGQVFGVAGLHVAGSSVFATGGTANPTLTAVALGLRLADNLRRNLRAHTRIELTSTPRPRVAVLGAGSRIRDVHLPVLRALSDSIEVAGFTSRSEESRAALAAESGWKSFATVEDLLERGSPDFVLSAVSGESNDALAWQAIGRRLPLLGETPLAWSERSGRALVSAARATGNIFGIAEQFATLPAMLLLRKLIALGGIGSITAVVNDFATYDYHGIAQLRALAGYERRGSRIQSRRFGFGKTGMMDGLPAPLPELGWPEEWELATIELSDGRLLTHHYSAGFEVLPTRPRGKFSVYGESGSVTDETLLFVDRRSGARHTAEFERQVSAAGKADLAELSVTHPSLGRIVWCNPFAGPGLSEEQISVALHMRAFAAAVKHRGAPLYSAAEALDDIEILRGLYYSAQTQGSTIALPLRTRWRQLHLLAHRSFRKFLRK
ncbi:MAG: GMC oxidoreductase, partial [Steroidobacteraceae bacterium]